MRRRWALAGVVVCAVIVGVGTTTVVNADAAAPSYGTYVPTPGLTIERVPYVTDLTTTSAEVNWAQSVPARGYAEYGPSGDCMQHTTPTASNSLPAFTPDTDHANAVTDQIGTTLGAWQSSVELTGLSPGQSYCYEVYDSTGTNLMGSGASQSFSTLDGATLPAAGLTFDVMGDTGQTTGSDESSTFVNEDQAAIYSEIGSSGAKFLLTAGDIGYSDGSDMDYGDLTTAPTSATTEISNVFGPSYEPESGGIPTFALDGNHGETITTLRTWPEEQSAENSNGVYAFDSYGPDSLIPATSSPDNWYAFSDGGVRIYVLDAAWSDSTQYLATTSATGAACTSTAALLQPTYCGGYQIDDAEHWQPSSPEMEWLKADLAAHPGGVKMAVFHYPLQSDNATQETDPYLDQDLLPVLEQGGVQMVFNGHAHTYQRFEQTGAPVEYVTGGGGGVLEPVQMGSTCAALVAKESVYALGWDPTNLLGSSCGVSAPAATSVIPADVYNFLRVTVMDNSVTVDPENALGQTFDPMTYPITGGGGSPTTTTTTTTPVTTTTGPSQGGPTPTTLPPNPTSSSAPVSADCQSHLPAGSVVGTAALSDGSGYYEVDSAGDVAAFGGAKCYGAMTGTPLSKPVVGMAVDPSTGGYWLVATDGGIFSFNAPFEGSTGAMHLNRPVVGMSASPDGRGYWFVASDGGIFSFGDAQFYGSTGAVHLNKAVVGMAASPGGHGYWLVASDGGIFSFGDAQFYGSTGAIHLNQPIVNMEVTGDGHGYRLIASDGGVFDFGNAPFYGSAGGLKLNRPMIGGADDVATGGYWLMASDGGVFTYNSPFLGSAA